MRCTVCRAPLQVKAHELKKYRDHRRIRIFRYHPCPRLDDPEAHPARHYPSRYFPFGSECAWCGADLEHEPARCRNKHGEVFCRPGHKDAGGGGRRMRSSQARGFR